MEQVTKYVATTVQWNQTKQWLMSALEGRFNTVQICMKTIVCTLKDFHACWILLEYKHSYHYFLVVQDVVPVREGPSLHILPREANMDPFLQQWPKCNSLSHCPINGALLHHLHAGCRKVRKTNDLLLFKATLHTTWMKQHFPSPYRQQEDKEIIGMIPFQVPSHKYTLTLQQDFFIYFSLLFVSFVSLSWSSSYIKE